MILVTIVWVYRFVCVCLCVLGSMKSFIIKLHCHVPTEKRKRAYNRIIGGMPKQHQAGRQICSTIDTHLFSSATLIHESACLRMFRTQH